VQGKETRRCDGFPAQMGASGVTRERQPGTVHSPGRRVSWSGSASAALRETSASANQRQRMIPAFCVSETLVLKSP
jgi:hypothetical protein